VTPSPVFFQTGFAIATARSVTIIHLVIVEAVERLLDPFLVSPPHAKNNTGIISKSNNSQPGRSN
jgi:hypothetical protein